MEKNITSMGFSFSIESGEFHFSQPPKSVRTSMVTCDDLDQSIDLTIAS